MTDLAEEWLAEGPGGVRVSVSICFDRLTGSEARRNLRTLDLVKGRRHPFLLTPHSFWSLDDRLVVVTEETDCLLSDLWRLYDQAGEKGVPADELTRLTAEVAEVLDFLHRHGVTHRSVRPESIYLHQGHVKLGILNLADYRDPKERRRPSAKCYGHDGSGSLLRSGRSPK